MPQSYPDIDYEDLINELSFDLSNGYAQEDSLLYVLRESESIYIENKQKEIVPVIDYFYPFPKLQDDLLVTTIVEAKKICFDALDKLRAENSNNEDMIESISMIISDLKDYTAGNKKRNDKKCRLVVTSGDNLPLMLYFEDTFAAASLEQITAKDLLNELKDC